MPLIMISLNLFQFIPIFLSESILYIRIKIIVHIFNHSIQDYNSSFMNQLLLNKQWMCYHILLLLTMLSLAHSGSSPCPTVSQSGSIFSNHLTISTQKSLIVFQPGENSLCYNYSLPYEFASSPRVAIGIDQFRSHSSNDLYFSIKPIKSQNQLFIPFIVRTYEYFTKWKKISFYFLVEDRNDIEAGYHQIDTGRLGSCESGKQIIVYLPFRELNNPYQSKKHLLFLNGFEISTSYFSGSFESSPFEVAILESHDNGTGLHVSIQVTTITKVHGIFLSYVAFEEKLSIVASSYSYGFEQLPKIHHTPLTTVGRNYARIHGISGFIINNSGGQMVFNAEWTGFKFQFNFEITHKYVQYFSYSYLFVVGSECDDCEGYPIAHQGKCLKTCPPGTFLTFQNACISCGNGKYWNGTACIKSCPSGQFLNYTTNDCQCPENQYWTGKDCITCKIGWVFNQKTNVCECPDSKIWDGFQCIDKIKCEQGKVWSFFTYSCECPIHTVWNGTYCVYTIPCLDGRVRDEQGECVCPEGKHWNGKYCETVSCSGGQYWNGQTCVCQIGFHFNGTFCLKCINGQSWNKILKRCECDEQYIWNGNFCEKVNRCTGGREWSEKYKQCICSEGQYWNGASCAVKPNCCCGKKWNEKLQECECDRGFNWDGHTCVQCMNGKNWDEDKRQCVCIEGTKWNGKFCVVVQKCYGGMIWNQNIWSCECPSTTVWKNGYCIANPCLNGQVWDQKLGYCICPKGKVLINGTCLPPELQCKGGQFWDPIIFACKCANNQWFNGKKCIDIPNCSNNQIYNPKNNKCECPLGLVWLAAQNICGDPTCPVNQMWNGQGCIDIACPPNSFYNGSECVCYKDRQECKPWQYFDGVQCKYYKNQCPKGTIWKNNKCVSDGTTCPDGTYQKHGKCVPIPQLCPTPCSYDRYSSSCKCPQDLCPPGTYLSHHKYQRQCIPYEKCPQGQIFSQQSLQCACPDPDLYNYNGKRCLTCRNQKVWVQTRGGKKCECPTGYFEVGDRCEQIIDQKRCINIPNSIWSPHKNQCICKPGFTIIGLQCVCLGTVINNQCQLCVQKPHSQWKFGICQCKEGYYEERNRCIKKGKWDGDDTESLCTVGTYFDDQQKKCISCPDGCLSCVDCYTCVQCREQFTLDPHSQLCVEHCGDQKKFVLQCDDGNNEDGDGCTYDCKIETGYICRGGSPNSKDICLQYHPNQVTILQVGQIRYSQTILLNLRVDYLPKQLLQSIECEDRCSNILHGEIVSGDQGATSIKTIYIPGTTFGFSMEIDFDRSYIGEFEILISLNPRLQTRYFKDVDISKGLRVQVNPAYLSRVDQEPQDQLS